MGVVKITDLPPEVLCIIFKHACVGLFPNGSFGLNIENFTDSMLEDVVLFADERVRRFRNALESTTVPYMVPLMRFPVSGWIQCSTRVGSGEQNVCLYLHQDCQPSRIGRNLLAYAQSSKPIEQYDSRGRYKPDRAPIEYEYYRDEAYFNHNIEGDWFASECTQPEEMNMIKDLMEEIEADVVDELEPMYTGQHAMF